MNAHFMPPTADIADSGVAAEELKQFVERAERMNEEIKALNDDKKDIFAEAKGRGFDTKTIKRIIQIRSQDHSARQEAEALLELYMNALGMN